MKNIIIAAVLVLVISTGLQARSQSSHKTVIVDSEKRSGWLGVSIQDVTKRLAEKKNLKSTEGAYVTDVSEDSPAEQAGFQKGDVIIKFDDKKVEDSEDLTRAVQKTSPGKEVKIDLLRDGQQKTVAAKIDKAPRSYSYSYGYGGNLMKNFRMPHINIPRIVSHYETYGLIVENLTKQLAEYFEVPNKKGALVMEVKKGSEAQKAGFKAGDVITKVDDGTIFDAEDFSEQLNDYDRNANVKIEVIRKGKPQTMTMKVEKEDDDEDSESMLMPNR